jgi:hypothetical protein
VSHIASVISELERQKDAIDRALVALRTVIVSAPKQRVSDNPAAVSHTKRRLSAEGRRNIIAAVKKRWAEKRAGQDSAMPKKTAPAKKTKRRVLSAEARKKMADAAKKRWAAQKKKQAA